MAFAYTGKGISGSGTDKGKHVTAMPIKDSRVCLRQPPSPRETLGGGGGEEEGGVTTQRTAAKVLGGWPVA